MSDVKVEALRKQVEELTVAYKEAKAQEKALLDPLTARIRELEAAIRRVLSDAESQEGGWGPDVTMVAVLQEALREPSVGQSDES